MSPTHATDELPGADELTELLSRPLVPLSEPERQTMVEVMSLYRSLPVMVWWRVPELVLIRRLSFEWPILDLGCGDGRMADVVFGRDRRLTVGLDLSEKDADRAHDSAMYRVVIRGDLCGTLPVGERQFATVFSNSVFEHVPRVDRLFDEIHRVLRPGGRLTFTVPSEHLNGMLRWPVRVRRMFGEAAAARWQRWWDRRVAHLNLGGEPFWRDLMERAGLEVLTCRPMLGPGLIGASERWQMRHNIGLGRLNLGNVTRGLIEGSAGLGWQGPGRALQRRNARRLLKLMAEEPADPGANLLFVAQRPV